MRISNLILLTDFIRSITEKNHLFVVKKPLHIMFHGWNACK